MNKKQTLIFVSVLFSVILILVVISKLGENNIFEELSKADINQIENLEFYRDGLRNEDGSLNLPIEEEKYKKECLDLLKNMQASGHTIKSLTTEYLYRIRFTLTVTESRLLTINVYRFKETGNLGIITIDEGDTFVASRGQYQSEALLKWLEKMKNTKKYKNIGSTY